MQHGKDTRPICCAHYRLAGVALVSLVVQLSACTSSPRTQTGLDEIAEPGPTSATEVVPDERPSEAGFLSLVQRYCGPLAVGDATIAERLRTDPAFRQLTTDLYHGNLSNDRYMRHLLSRYPAADANVDATGCVVNQMQKCYTKRCSVPVSERSLPERNPQETLEVYD